MHVNMYLYTCRTLVYLDGFVAGEVSSLKLESNNNRGCATFTVTAKLCSAN